MIQVNPGTFTNWAQNQRCSPSAAMSAQTVRDVQDAVSLARERNLKLRVRGSGHSFTPLVCTDDLLLDVSGLSGVQSIDIEQSRVTVGAGTTIAALGSPLWDQGLSLSNQGDIDAQTIAGAISTATHGSGLAFTGFSGAVTGVEMVTAAGELLHVTEAMSELDGVRTSLGSLGVITAVELQVMPAYQLAERISFWSLDEVIERWEHETSTRRHFSFFWGPFPGSLAMYGLGADPAGLSNPCFVKRYEELPSDASTHNTRDRRVDRAYRIFPQSFDLEFYELEYFVPYSAAPDAIEAVRDEILAHPEQRFPLEVRTIGKETGWLSPMYGADAVSLSVSGVPGTHYEPFLRAVDATLRQFSARPHWGKLHFFDAARLEEVYPAYRQFVDLRRQMDPDGLFLNDHLEGMLG